MIDKKNILVEVSNRHIHISKDNLNILFGKDYELEKEKELSQPGEFASTARVTLKNGNNSIENVRVLGPLREKTQVEISRTDARRLKIDAPLRNSGDIENTPGVTIVGPESELKLDEGVIVAKRHIHMLDEDAKELGLEDNEFISIKISGERSVTFNKVLVRANKNFKTAVHIDMDDGNAAGIDKNCFGELVTQK